MFHLELIRVTSKKTLISTYHRRPLLVHPQPAKVPYTFGGNSPSNSSIFELTPCRSIGGEILNITVKKSILRISIEFNSIAMNRTF